MMGKVQPSLQSYQHLTLLQVLSVLTCNAADLWETHHDLREAFGLVWVLVFSVVLTHIPVALVQLLQLGGIGQSSYI